MPLVRSVVSDLGAELGSPQDRSRCPAWLGDVSEETRRCECGDSGARNGSEVRGDADGLSVSCDPSPSELEHWRENAVTPKRGARSFVGPAPGQRALYASPRASASVVRGGVTPLSACPPTLGALAESVATLRVPRAGAAVDPSSAPPSASASASRRRSSPARPRSASQLAEALSACETAISPEALVT